MSRTTKDKDPKGGDDKKLMALQLQLLEGIDQQTLQSRFEDFCQRAIDSLTVTNAMGEPVIEAGKGVAEFIVKVKVVRMADDSMTFAVAHEVGEKHPRVPGLTRTAPLVTGVGLAQRVSVRQAPLFDPAHGQPRALSIAEAEGVMDDGPARRKRDGAEDAEAEDDDE